MQISINLGRRFPRAGDRPQPIGRRWAQRAQPFAALGLALGLLACAPQIAEAPFTTRPDSVLVGDLRGPFSGQVVDAGTGNPISGALVFASWVSWSGGLAGTTGAVHAPLSAYTRSAVTRPDGGYELAELPISSAAGEPGSLLRRFTLIVYKAGFLGYRSDLRYEDRAPRRDFAQRGQVIKLERFPEGESHTRHLAFLGGGAELRRVAQAEYTLASLELSDRLAARAASEQGALGKDDKDGKGGRAPTSSPSAEPAFKAPTAAELLTVARLQEVSGSKLAFTASKLPEVEPAGGALTGAEFYDGVHLRAADRPETSDAALRVWRTQPAALASARYERVKAALARAGKVREAGAPPKKPAAPSGQVMTRSGAPMDQLPPRQGERSLVAFDTRRRIYGALVLKQDLVLQLSCGAELCPREELVLKLMNQILQALPTPPGAEVTR